ncbi:glycosyltransferase family 4 protein [Gimesia fumaroli]|uniref:D-inositol 3-phosphate glycosyltransferase n=1 Tax=Gimesia fumaroli TaxID=2527976 RepID=A0A518IGE9_9PLAN|nr:glycosyltransferase family 4 protein [Gimesia fumaroli]QDV52166.1 D-inositol 3-phosphate glycosyltransferase [Gimesia fumaroli]
MTESKQHICIGPIYHGIGFWEWTGKELGEELSQYFDIEFFADSIPHCDLAIIVKYDFPQLMETRPADVPIIYCPVDRYGFVRDIDRDGKKLFQCQQIITHSESLRKYFHSYAPVEYLDHHLRFISKSLAPRPEEDPILWTGICSNLPPLIEWVNQNPLPRELWILTNLDQEASTVPPGKLGFNGSQSVHIENWTPDKHIKWAELASCAIDIKGTDFRARHKPPTKAIECIASGLSLAMISGSSNVRYLAKQGFEVASVEDQDFWFSNEYRKRTLEFGAELRKRLSRENIGKRFKMLIDRILEDESSKSKKRFDVSNPSENFASLSPQQEKPNHQQPVSHPHQKIAIVSFLYNWPSTGGGNIHTTELVQFLTRAGYEVQHFCVRYDPWQIGQIEAGAPIQSQILNFAPEDWKANTIRNRIRRTVREWGPDCVLITDSWNFKPHLADAVNEFPYFLRMQALECLCPLNNLQILPGPQGVIPCENNQFINPETCFNCLVKNRSGQLHQLERQLSGVGSTEYNELLQQSFQNAEAVLVLNPTIAAQYESFCDRVEVVTWGMDESRFPWPPPADEQCPSEISESKVSIIFAGLIHEPIKGFPVLLAVCEQLWKTRQDFELIVTSDPPQEQDEFVKYVGWKSQAELPRWYRHSDLCVVPTVVPDGLSRTSVEAMASGLAVIASNTGGLPFSVSDQKTGLLCEPGVARDWTSKLNQLLDDPEQLNLYGENGRKQYEERFRWKDVIERDYQQLFNKLRQPLGNFI